MKHFNYISEEKKEEIFYKKPEEFDRFNSKEDLQYALGSLLYMPADKEGIANMVINRKYPQLTSMSWCLEDALGDGNIELAENNIFIQLENIYKAVEEGELKEEYIPLIFVRVRNVEQLRKLLKRMKKIENVDILKYFTGFIFPKFNSETGISYLDSIHIYNQKAKYQLYVMPILESGLVMYKETRNVELMRIQSILTKEQFKDIILNVRLGATDFSSLYGLRRSINHTVYDINVLRDVITDILNFFNRKECNFVVSGPVWEYFNNNSNRENRLLKPTLRMTPFKDNLDEREMILGQAIDGLISEVLLDKINGLCGKTTIHPTHIKYINALQCVTQEEYEDACAILNSNGSGVMKGSGGNKMNEVKPHTTWANKIIAKSKIYGVLNEGVNYACLF